MKNDKWQFIVGTPDFYLSLFICHFSFDRKSVLVAAGLRRVNLCLVAGGMIHGCAKKSRGGWASLWRFLRALSIWLCARLSSITTATYIACRPFLRSRMTT